MGTLCLDKPRVSRVRGKLAQSVTTVYVTHEAGGFEAETLSLRALVGMLVAIRVMDDEACHKRRSVSSLAKIQQKKVVHTNVAIFVKQSQVMIDPQSGELVICGNKTR